MKWSAICHRGSTNSRSVSTAVRVRGVTCARVLWRLNDNLDAFVYVLVAVNQFSHRPQYYYTSWLFITRSARPLYYIDQARTAYVPPAQHAEQDLATAESKTGRSSEEVSQHSRQESEYAFGAVD